MKPGLHVTSGIPQQLYGGNETALRAVTDLTTCADPHSFMAIGRLNKSMYFRRIGVAARLLRVGTVGSGFAGKA
jgi:hypothetical protein